MSDWQMSEASLTNVIDWVDYNGRFAGFGELSYKFDCPGVDDDTTRSLRLVIHRGVVQRLDAETTVTKRIRRLR